MTRVPPALPDDYWAPMAPYREMALRHPEGMVDLTMGSPVDPVPPVVREALAAAGDAHGYPATAGRPELRASLVGWLRRRFGVTGLDPDAVLPTPGSKELIAHLALQVGVRPGDLVVIPELAYPTYEHGAILAGARVRATTSLTALGPETPALVWVNSPSNPTGQVLPPDHLRKMVDWCRERDALLVSDECYLENVYDDRVPVTSVLHESVSGGSHDNVLAVHSLSKRSNMAGYRCASVSGDPALVRTLLGVRRQLGLGLPLPQQAAMQAALDDDAHVAEQHQRYADRRAALGAALEEAGFAIDHSEGALYLWARRDGEDAWQLADWFARRGVLVAGGPLYGRRGSHHVRLAFTVTDDAAAAAATRIMAP